MMRAGMVEALATERGLEYIAREEASPFLELLESAHLRDLRQYATWVVSEFGGLDAVEIRDRISGVMDSWSEELGDLAPAEAVMEQEDDG